MAEPEVFDWDEWENGKVYQLSNDELVGALLSEVSALRKRLKALEDRHSELTTLRADAMPDADVDAK